MIITFSTGNKLNNNIIIWNIKQLVDSTFFNAFSLWGTQFFSLQEVWKTNEIKTLNKQRLDLDTIKEHHIKGMLIWLEAFFCIKCIFIYQNDKMGLILIIIIKNKKNKRGNSHLFLPSFKDIIYFIAWQTLNYLIRNYTRYELYITSLV